MKTSSQGIDLIKQFEGCELDAYLDAVGVPTIGYGTTLIGGKPVPMGLSITEQQAEEYLAFDLVKFEKAINNLVKVNLTQEMFDALVCFTYNLGVGAFGGSTLLKLLNNGEYEKVPAQFLRWSKAKGKVLPGLVRRRRAEAELFRSGIANL